MVAARLGAVVPLCLVVACGTRDTTPREPTYPVSGTVTVKGMPAFEVRVMAIPAGAPADSGRQVDALTDDAGKFRFGTYTDSDGLPPGKYDIRLTWPDVVRRSDPSLEVDRFGGRYNSPANPAFTIDVKETDNTLPPFNLK